MPKKNKKKKKIVKKKTSRKSKKSSKKSGKKPNKKIIKAHFIGESITSSTKEAKNLYSNKRFGEIIRGKVHYSLPEALYLTDRKKMEVYAKTKKLSFSELMKKLKEIDKKIETKFFVFKNIRNRGYIIKSALKFGADFRVYDRGVLPGKKHARWILYPVRESDELTWHDFSAKNRVAHSTKKKLLIGIVDDEGDVSFYEVAWIRP